MTHSTARDRHQLETLWQLPTSQSRSEKNRIFQLLTQAGGALAAFLTGQQQLRIWTKSTRHGIVWFAYDPALGQRISRSSERELRTWLESRHLHPTEGTAFRSR